MTTFEERIENMARGEYERHRYKKDTTTWDDLPFDNRQVFIEWARLNATDFLDGDEVFEVTKRWGDSRDLNGVEAWEGDPMPSGCEMGEYIGVLVRLEVPEDE